jgi:hypothetical protein
LLGQQEPLPPPARHDELGRWMLAEALWERETSRRMAEAAFTLLAPEWDAADRMMLIDAVTGHHGRPPHRDSFFLDSAVGAAAFEAAAHFVVDLVGTFDPPPLAHPQLTVTRSRSRDPTPCIC